MEGSRGEQRRVEGGIEESGGGGRGDWRGVGVKGRGVEESGEE